MSRMEAVPLGIEGTVAFSPAVYRDDRGQFSSPFQEDAFLAAVGRPLFPVRDVSLNRSAAGVLRGIHYTATPPGRAKYVYCASGCVQDVLVDLRVGSPTFGRHVAGELDDRESRALYVPPGVGHAFLSLVDDSVVVYVMSAGYSREDELVVSATDAELALPWPDLADARLSDRDRAAPTLDEARARGLLPDHRTCREVEEALWA